MKDFLKNFFKWSSIWLGIVFVLWVSYFAIKARVATNPWISDTTPWSLYVNNNETLTAAKRNSMIANSKTNYKKVSLTNGDYQTTTSATLVPGADITMTTSTSPVLIMMSLPIINNWASASAIYCDLAIDWVKLTGGSWSFRASLGVWYAETLNYNYITAALTAGSHDFKVYCWSDWWRILIKKTSTTQGQFNVLELKQ